MFRQNKVEGKSRGAFTRLINKKSILVILVFTALGIVTILHNPKIYAASNGPWPDTDISKATDIPASVINTVTNECSQPDWHIVQVVWLSAAPDPSQGVPAAPNNMYYNNLEVDYGTTQVSVWLNYVVDRCRSNNSPEGGLDIYSLQYSYGSNSGTLGSQETEIKYPTSVGGYIVGHITTFTINNLNVANNGVDINITGDSRGTILYSPSNWACAISNDNEYQEQGLSGWSDFHPSSNECPEGGVSFPIEVDVLPWQLAGQSRVQINNGSWVYSNKTNAPVNAGTMSSADIATFENQIQNTNADNNSGSASYHWYVQGCKYNGSNDCTDSGGNSSNWTNLQCGTTNYGTDSCTNNGCLPVDYKSDCSSSGSVTEPVGSYYPTYGDDDSSKVKFSFLPSHPVNGETYCERINYTNWEGLGSGNQQSGPVCVTYSAPPPPAPSATCSIAVNNPLAGTNGQGVATNQPFSVTMTITNNSTGDVPLPATMDGHTLNVDTRINSNSSPLWALPGIAAYNDKPDGPWEWPVPNVPSDGLQPGQSISFTRTFNGPTAVGSYVLEMHADYYYDSPSLMQGDCGTLVTGYQPFKLNPISQGSFNDDEDPTQFTYTTGVDTTYADGSPQSFPVSVSADSCVYVEVGSNDTCTFGGGQMLVPTTGGPYTYPANTKTYAPGQGLNAVYNIPAGTTLSAGTTYCTEIDLSYTSGYMGPSGSIDTSGGGPFRSCDTIENKPFLKVYDSGVSAGGDFGSSCSGGGELASWNNDTGTYPAQDFGASAQFSALALSDITGFASGESPDSLPAYALSLSNTQNIGGASSDSPSLGGQYGSNCLTSYQPSNSTGTYNVTDSNSSDSISGIQSKYSSQLASGPVDVSTAGNNTNFTFSGGTINSSQNIAIFVKGNVYINGDVKYGGDNGQVGQVNGSTSVGWNSVSHVPSFAIVATGNIYIDPSVTELDGLYVSGNSLPGASGNDGSIYTCGTSAFAPMLASQLYTNCNNQLTVYGAFEANNVDLMRTYGSLRDESSLIPASPCSNAGTGTIHAAQTCAAEVFDFSPELYLSNPALLNSGDGGPDVQAITSLPPVL